MTNFAIQNAGSARFVAPSDGRTVYEPVAWSPLLVSKAEIAAEVERLSSLSIAKGAGRASLIVHPEASAPGLEFAPGMALTVNVLNPGEEIEINRDNANRVEFCISGGEGIASISDRTINFSRFDVWTVPSMARRRYRNQGNAPLAWFSYSNVPLLEMLGIHYSDTDDVPGRTGRGERSAIEKNYVRESAPDIAIGDRGARLRGYEFLTDIEVVDNPALHWRWQEVSPHLAQEPDDGKRILLLLYNPATERRNGTTHSFFATLSRWPTGKESPVPARGHRHSSFACNYHFLGRGSSIVDGRRFDWEAGDLMLSAPNWTEHAHGSSIEGAAVLTIQDHPFQIGAEALIWQERMGGPILALGSEPGQTGYVGPRLAGE